MFSFWVPHMLSKYPSQKNNHNFCLYLVIIYFYLITLYTHFHHLQNSYQKSNTSQNTMWKNTKFLSKSIGQFKIKIKIEKHPFLESTCYDWNTKTAIFFNRCARGKKYVKIPWAMGRDPKAREKTKGLFYQNSVVQSGTKKNQSWHQTWLTKRDWE